MPMPLRDYTTLIPLALYELEKRNKNIHVILYILLRLPWQHGGALGVGNCIVICSNARRPRVVQYYHLARGGEGMLTVSRCGVLRIQNCCEAIPLHCS